MTLMEQISEDVKAAMRSGDTLRRDTLRLLLARMKDAAIEKGGGRTLEDADALAVIQKQVKQREESIQAFQDRPDLRQKEEAERAILQHYLPAALTDAELEDLVNQVVAELNASSMKDMGPVMKEALARSAGRADGSRISPMVRRRLAG